MIDIQKMAEERYPVHTGYFEREIQNKKRQAYAQCYADLKEKGLVNEWVSVSERLPDLSIYDTEEFKMVSMDFIVSDGKLVYTAYFLEGRGFEEHLGIIKWMNWPQP